MAERELAKIKGDKDGLCLVIDAQADVSLIVNDLRHRLESSPGFFHGGTLRLEATDRSLSAEEMELISNTIAEFGMVLNDTDDGAEKDVPDSNERGTAKPTRAEGADAPAQWERLNMVDYEDGRALLVKRTLRSGQSVTFDGNVIIRGDVNPGAMITSTGDIIVLGALRGVAHAGASGDTMAVVIAFRLEPTQLRIASAISRAPDGKVPRPSGPEVARVKGDIIQIEAYNP